MCRLRKAFTLIEMITVLVIIGILVGVTIPRIEVMYLIKFQGAGRKLLSDIRYVQNQAVVRDTDTRIAFNTGTETYSAQYYNTATSTWVNLSDPLTQGNLQMDFRTDAQFDGVNISSAVFGGTGTLRFNWRGTPQNSTGTDLTADGTVVLTFHGSSITITVTPQTGYVDLTKNF